MPEITAAPAVLAVPVPRRTPAPAPAPDRAPAPPPAPTRRPAPTPPPPRGPAEPAAVLSACATCTHPACRARRSASQPRMYGRTSEFTPEHRTAAAIQARHPHAVVWFGESTQSYWSATPTALTEAPDPDTPLLNLWAGSASTPSRC